MPTFLVHAPVASIRSFSSRRFCKRWRKPRGWASCAPIRWIPSPARTAATISHRNAGHALRAVGARRGRNQADPQGGGCENKNIQYSVPPTWNTWAAPTATWRACASAFCHAVWQAQGKAARRVPWACALAATAPTATISPRASSSAPSTTSIPTHAAKLEAEILEGQPSGRRRDGFRRKSLSDRMQDRAANRLPASFFVSVAYGMLGVPPLGRAPGCLDRRHHEWLYRDPASPVERMARGEGFR